MEANKGQLPDDGVDISTLPIGQRIKIKGINSDSIPENRHDQIRLSKNANTFIEATIVHREGDRTYLGWYKDEKNPSCAYQRDLNIDESINKVYYCYAGVEAIPIPITNIKNGMRLKMPLDKYGNLLYHSRDLISTNNETVSVTVANTDIKNDPGRILVATPQFTAKHGMWSISKNDNLNYVDESLKKEFKDGGGYFFYKSVIDKCLLDVSLPKTLSSDSSNYTIFSSKEELIPGMQIEIPLNSNKTGVIYSSEDLKSTSYFTATYIGIYGYDLLFATDDKNHFNFWKSDRNFQESAEQIVNSPILQRFKNEYFRQCHTSIIPLLRSKKKEEIKKSESSIPNKEESNKQNPVNFKTDLNNAAYRIASKQIVKAIKSLIIQTMKDKGHDTDNLSVILNTEIGDSLISFILGSSLPLIIKDPRLQHLSKDFRVNGMTIVGNAVISTILEHCLPLIESFKNDNKNQELDVKAKSNFRLAPPEEISEREELNEKDSISAT